MKKVSLMVVACLGVAQLGFAGFDDSVLDLGGLKTLSTMAKKEDGSVQNMSLQIGCNEYEEAGKKGTYRLSLNRAGAAFKEDAYGTYNVTAKDVGDGVGPNVLGPLSDILPEITENHVVIMQVMESVFPEKPIHDLHALPITEVKLPDHRRSSCEHILVKVLEQLDAEKVTILHVLYPHSFSSETEEALKRFTKARIHMCFDPARCKTQTCLPFASVPKDNMTSAQHR